nr:innexin inx2-like [Onthophagus taurus]
MMDFLNSFKSLIKLEQIHTDNNIFKLHYKFTMIMLIVFSILLTSKQYFGDPIDCEVQDRSSEVIETYCWIFGTFTIKKTLNENILSGLGPDPRLLNDLLQDSSSDEIITQKYYQWVCIVFCFQALLFYIPRYLWKTWEGGRLRLLAKDLGGPLIPNCWNKETKERLISYMLSGNYSHNLYALRFAFCELLNFINVVCQIVFMDWFLSGQFTDYGIALALYNGENPMTRVFPKVTKCTYYNYGPSGGRQRQDALCVLPLNIVNEKLFLILWVWFLILAIVSFYVLIYRTIVLVSPKIRMYLLMAHAKFLSRKTASIITCKISFGDYFFLHQLGKNLNPLTYKDLLISIANVLFYKSSLPYNPEVTMPV